MKFSQTFQLRPEGGSYYVCVRDALRSGLTWAASTICPSEPAHATMALTQVLRFRLNCARWLVAITLTRRRRLILHRIGSHVVSGGLRLRPFCAAAPLGVQALATDRGPADEMLTG